MFDQLPTLAALAVLNRWLAREAWAREKLTPFAGRTARLELPPMALAFVVMPEGTLAAASSETQADVTLTADTAALPLLLVDPKALMRNVKLQGDAEFAQALGFVLQNLKPEPEEDLARFIGDAAAVRIVNGLRTAFAHALDAGQRMSVAAADYLVAEDRVLASRQEVDAFVQEVNELRDATERAEARLRELEAEVVAAAQEPQSRAATSTRSAARSKKL